MERQLDLNAARKQAAIASSDGSSRYVVWVQDQGRDVYTAKQLAFWQDFAFIEAIYVGGCEVANCVRRAA